MEPFDPVVQQVPPSSVPAGNDTRDRSAAHANLSPVVIDGLALRARWAAPLFRQLAFPVMVVGAHRELHYANPAALVLLGEARVLVLSGNRLEAITLADRSRLDHLLQRALAVAVPPIREACPTGALSIGLMGRGVAPMLTVSAVPADGSHPGHPAAEIILMLSRRPASLTPDAGLLQTLFHLTESEAAITQALWRGQTVNEIAAARLTSAATVRSQIRSVFAKTFVTRQQDLILLLASLPQLALRSESAL